MQQCKVARPQRRKALLTSLVAKVRSEMKQVGVVNKPNLLLNHLALTPRVAPLAKSCNMQELAYLATLSPRRAGAHKDFSCEHAGTGKAALNQLIVYTLSLSLITN
ncbi:hypothetical protein J6590_049954 [Homalodisca vitripennis]|nr:hypothetical protein J6590_049954 [Homalodisca vitripennis]